MGNQNFKLPILETPHLPSETVNPFLVVVVVIGLFVLHPHVFFNACVGTTESVTVVSSVRRKTVTPMNKEVKKIS